MLSPAGEQLGLDRTIQLLDRLGNPHRALPPMFHVAGTNGKGSTCAFLRAALEAAGYATHVFSSPHLVRYNERIRLAGRLIDDDLLAALLTEVIDAAHGIEPSFFEVTTVAAFLAFARIPADACIVEVGLGGRLDSTNVIACPLVCGIAAIGLDHQQFLGNSLGGIAAEKAGIARRGIPLVSVTQAPEAAAAIVAGASQAGAPLLLEGRDWALDRGLKPSLAGGHQVRNANLACQMLAAQDCLEVPRAVFQKTIGDVRWPARFQRLRDGPLTQGLATWVDGAHNPQAAHALARLLDDVGPMHIVLGILATKDAPAIVAALQPHALSLTFVPVPDHDHHDPTALAERFGGRVAESLEEALRTLPAPRLIAGSLYLAGAALECNGQVPD
jgi:dihydrofolate synthase/folylpolyglutamate synthase